MDGNVRMTTTNQSVGALLRRQRSRQFIQPAAHQPVGPGYTVRRLAQTPSNDLLGIYTE